MQQGLARLKVLDGAAWPGGLKCALLLLPSSYRSTPKDARSWPVNGQKIDEHVECRSRSGGQAHLDGVNLALQVTSLVGGDRGRDDSSGNTTGSAQGGLGGNEDAVRKESPSVTSFRAEQASMKTH